MELGPKAKCLVDLGHAPDVNIEKIVARLHSFGKLGGFHFNDSKYGDDNLVSGLINPHQLFQVFNGLVEAELNPRGLQPASIGGTSAKLRVCRWRRPCASFRHRKGWAGHGAKR